MRVLLVQHASENTEAYPLGLGIVAAALLEAGHEVDFIDLALAPGDPLAMLAERAGGGEVEALGFTLLTPQYGEFLHLAHRFRSLRPGIPIVAGGPHAQALPEETLRDKGADVAVLAEGERVAPRLFEALARGSGLEEVEGIAFLEPEGTFRMTAPAPQVADLEAVPYPPWELIRPDRYPGRYHGQRYANVLTSRGCPYRCVYCHRGPTGGRRVRMRSIAHVLGEVRRLHRDFGIGAFGFRDDIFTFDRARTWALCDALLAEPGRIYWNCETRVDRVDRELLAQMRRAGCICVDFGIESGSDEILRRLRKQATVAQARAALRYCREVGMPTRAFYLIGTPWETPQTLEETITFAKETKATMSFFFLATPYPGTELREAFLEAGWPIPDDYARYRHHVEGRDFEWGAPADGDKNPQRFFAAECRRATRAVVRAQLADIPGYPALLRAYFTRFTLGEFGARVRERLRRAFL
ncbi:MAG: cobalamin-dependent protein [Candidatus Eisenbacteria sp.]|nr:cobalamin-dependent protein [Candidatus Eisenbacteria bacterium]